MTMALTIAAVQTKLPLALPTLQFATILHLCGCIKMQWSNCLSGFLLTNIQFPEQFTVEPKIKVMKKRYWLLNTTEDKN